MEQDDIRVFNPLISGMMSNVLQERTNRQFFIVLL
ncbi:hypothetical protein FHS11_003485 [Mucilaginibacter gotjawali]|uniref:Uncharacterized protein n=1 Tax=Mucilaginibacter gotjawali TaxID=1550579 RepID=A0A839SKR5_9SPHI|nr:hypothetical protein [Mucilaginibacter gotjawali]